MSPDGLRFADQGILWAALIAVLPIALHILDRRRARKVDWAAMQFFGDARRTLRWMRLQDLLLLAARCGTLVALPLCLARPHAEVRGSSRVVHAGRRAVALVLDDSPSMAWTQVGGSSRFERAKEAALEIVDSLRAGDEVLILAPGMKEGEAVLAASPAAARGRVLEMAPRPQRRGLLDLLEEAARRAPAAAAAVREVHVLTDLQGTAWAPADPERLRLLAKELEAAGPRPVAAILDVSEGKAAENRAIVDLASSRPLVGAGEEAAITVRVRAWRGDGGGTGEGATEVRLTLSVDGEPRESRAVTVSPGEPAAARFELRLPEARTYRLEAQVEGDGLPADDRRFLALDARERVKVLIADDRAGSGRLESEGGLLELALAPSPRGLPAPRTLFEPRACRPADLVGSGLSGYPVIVSANIEDLPEEAVRRLEERVREGGGGALFFTGARANVASVNAKLHRGGKGLLPLEVLGREEGAEAALAPVEGSHPALAAFAGSAGFAQVRVRSRLRTRAARGAQVLMSFEGGLPFAAEKSFGRGAVVQVASGASHRDGTFAAHPLFLPWLHNLAGYLATRGEPARNLEAGSPLVLELAPAEREAEVRLEGPGGAVDLAPREEGGRILCRAGDAVEPGFHAFRVRTAAGSRTSVYTVNLPGAESDLTPLGAPERQALAAALGASIVSSAAEALGTEVATVGRVDGWRVLAAAAVLLLLAELLLARLMARERVALAPARVEAAPLEAAQTEPDAREAPCSSP